MAVSRTIYTQGAVLISGNGINNRYLSGVQSANFTVSEPKQDVNEMGVLGSINKVQLEAVSASLDITACILNENTGILPYLVASSKLPNPSYYNILVSGIGELRSGLLSSFNIEASVGNIPQITFHFDGRSGTPQTAGATPTTPNIVSLNVLTPDAVSGIDYDGAATCAQTLRLSWEMPVERLTCLGSPIDTPLLFTRPPGTTTINLEGTTSPSSISEIDIGPYIFIFNNYRIVSRANNMAIGDAKASFNITEETNGFGLSVIETNTAIDTGWVSNESSGAGVATGDNQLGTSGSGNGKIWSDLGYTAGSWIQIFFDFATNGGGNGTVYLVITPNNGVSFTRLRQLFLYTGGDPDYVGTVGPIQIPYNCKIGIENAPDTNASIEGEFDVRRYLSG